MPLFGFRGSGAGAARRPDFWNLLRPWSVAVRIAGAAVFIYVIVMFAFFANTVPGTPEHVGTKYYFDDHGQHIKTTRSEFLAAVREDDRSSNGYEVVFFGAAALLTTPTTGGGNPA